MANARTSTSITGLLSSLTLWSTAIFLPQIPTCAPATTEPVTISAGVAFRSGGRCYSVSTLGQILPTEVATTQDCSGSPLVDAAKKTKSKYGEYFGSAFTLHEGELNQGTLYLLW